MIYNEKKMNLFDNKTEYYLVHCISSDFALGKGIALNFNKYFNLKNKLKYHFPDYYNNFNNGDGGCIIIDNILNLVTKKNYYDKPTYDSLEKSLIAMKECCEKYNIKKLAMPLIGCGLDRLNWNYVSKIIRKIFENNDIEILVCKI